MMPYQSYQLWQAERPKSGAEQRAADIRRGEFAAMLARLRPAARRAVLAGGARVAARPRIAARPGPAVQPRPAAGLAGVCNTEG